MATRFSVKLSSTRPLLRSLLASLLLLRISVTGAFPAALFDAEVANVDHHPAQGMAWNVQGHWKDERTGAEIATGDPVLPGSLVSPLRDPGAHSLTVLLPDGQRVLSECFTADDCSRGFRIPAITEPPPQFSVEMLDRMRTVLKHTPIAASSDAAHCGQMTPARQDELVAALLPRANSSPTRLFQVKVQGLLGSMPNGSYTYTLRSWDGPPPVRLGLLLQRTSSGYMFPVAGPGLYRISIFDSLNMERLNLLVAAVGPGQTKIVADFAHAKKVLASWDERYAGWPIHDLLRAYLRSFDSLEAVRQTSVPRSR